MTRRHIYQNTRVPRILALYRENPQRMHKDIAAQIGCSRSNVSRAIARWRDKLAVAPISRFGVGKG